MGKEVKAKCKICKQIVTPLPDGSCPICDAPREMLIILRDKDEGINPMKK